MVEKSRKVRLRFDLRGERAERSAAHQARVFEGRADGGDGENGDGGDGENGDGGDGENGDGGDGENGDGGGGENGDGGGGENGDGGDRENGDGGDGENGFTSEKRRTQRASEYALRRRPQTAARLCFFVSLCEAVRSVLSVDHVYQSWIRGRYDTCPLGMSGRLRRRTPVAAKIAFPIAGATAMIGVSPAPAEGRSLRSSRTSSIGGTSVNRGTR